MVTLKGCLCLHDAFLEGCDDAGLLAFVQVHVHAARAGPVAPGATPRSALWGPLAISLMCRNAAQAITTACAALPF